MPEPLLTLDAVSVRYGHIRALKGVSLAVHRGSIVSIIGSNGAGKSTLLKTVMGLVEAESGDIRYAGQPITRQGVTYYEQTPSEFAADAKRIKEAGADMIGGCCGTTPAFIRQVAAALAAGQITT